MDLPPDAIITPSDRRLDLTGRRSGRLVVLEYAYSKLVGKRQEQTPHWLCQCDCGNQHIVSGKLIKLEKIQSCGCYADEARKLAGITRRGSGNFSHLPPGETAFNALYGACRSSARERDYEFTLSKEIFRELITSNCHYCGDTPSNQKWNNSTEPSVFIWNGIDRKDSDLGYILENVVPCCTPCNHLKGSRPYEVFKDLIRGICRNLDLI